VLVDHTRASCTLPPGIGLTRNLTLTINGQSTRCPYVSYAGPFIRLGAFRILGSPRTYGPPPFAVANVPSIAGGSVLEVFGGGFLFFNNTPYASLVWT
jgi:hypothetical protein